MVSLYNFKSSFKCERLFLTEFFTAHTSRAKTRLENVIVFYWYFSFSQTSTIASKAHEENNSGEKIE